jgi:hypothetical protein
MFSFECKMVMQKILPSDIKFSFIKNLSDIQYLHIFIFSSSYFGYKKLKLVYVLAKKGNGNRVKLNL